MKKIKYIIFLLLCLSAAPALSFAADDYKNELSITNGNSLNDSSDNSKYKNSLSVNEGMAVNQKSFDFRLDSGLLASIKMSNPDIVFRDFIPSSSVYTGSNVNIGVTVHTAVSTIKRIGYRISQSPPTMESGGYTYIYEYQDGSVQSSQTITVSAIVASEFQPGINYVQWYAQNNVNVDGNTATWEVRVGVSSNSSINILQPGKISSSNPQIQAKIYSPYGFHESSVTIKMYTGVSTAAAALNTENGGGKFVDGILDYKYTGKALTHGHHTVLIELVDYGGVTTSAMVTFDVSGGPIADLLPYPSPYNPKKGLMNIRFVIAEQASVTINIYDRAGKLVSQVLNSVSKPAGENKVTWNAKSYAGDSLANGVYICEIITTSGGKENKRYKSFAILRK
ncbi:MAG: hypothetical protein LBL00_00915 [Endomicrobium sp.]|jgi:hypothetical protein|nr:hypothetical protein [Endomicrobium sp.]